MEELSPVAAGDLADSRGGGVRRLFCSTRSRSAKLGACLPAEGAEGAGAEEPGRVAVAELPGRAPSGPCAGAPARTAAAPPAMTRTGATGVAGCSRASSARASGRPPFCWIAATCLSNGTGARGGGGRATTGRLRSAAGGRATLRPAFTPSTLWRLGTMRGGADVTAAPARAAAGRRTTCPPARCPAGNTFCGTAVTAPAGVFPAWGVWGVVFLKFGVKGLFYDARVVGVDYGER